MHEVVEALLHGGLGAGRELLSGQGRQGGSAALNDLELILETGNVDAELRRLNGGVNLFEGGALGGDDVAHALGQVRGLQGLTVELGRRGDQFRAGPLHDALFGEGLVEQGQRAERGDGDGDDRHRNLRPPDERALGAFRLAREDLPQERGLDPDGKNDDHKARPDGEHDLPPAPIESTDDHATDCGETVNGVDASGHEAKAAVHGIPGVALEDVILDGLFGRLASGPDEHEHEDEGHEATQKTTSADAEDVRGQVERLVPNVPKARQVVSVAAPETAESDADHDDQANDAGAVFVAATEGELSEEQNEKRNQERREQREGQGHVVHPVEPEPAVLLAEDDGGRDQQDSDAPEDPTPLTEPGDEGGDADEDALADTDRHGADAPVEDRSEQEAPTDDPDLLDGVEVDREHVREDVGQAGEDGAVSEPSGLKHGRQRGPEGLQPGADGRTRGCRSAHVVIVQGGETVGGGQGTAHVISPCRGVPGSRGGMRFARRERKPQRG